MAEMKHARKKVKLKKGYAFRRFLIVWVLLLIIVGVVAVVSVNKMLKEMQANAPEQYISDVLNNLTDAQIKEAFEFNTELEGSDSLANVRKFFADGKYTVKQNRETGVYNIYNGDRMVIGLDLEKVRTVKKFLIFNYSVLNLKNIVPSESKELYHCEIAAGSDYKVTVNGKAVEPTTEKIIDGFESAASYVDLPSEDVYILDHLTKEPAIEITKDGKKVDFEYSEKIAFETEYPKFNSLSEAGCSLDLIRYAEDWSRFLTADLEGTYGGFYNITKYFINDSDMYQRAYNWLNSIDYTFTSIHELKDPPFTGQSVKNVVKYSDNAYSADVHVTKHMHLNNGNDQDDTINSTVYIVKYNGEWKVVNMRTAIDN